MNYAQCGEDQCLYLQNNTQTLWNNSCSFSRDLVHGTRWTSPPFCKFVLWTTTVLSDKLDIPYDHQNQLDKPSLIYCVTWLCKLFSLSYLFAALHGQQTRPLSRAQAPPHGQETSTDPWSYLTRMANFDLKKKLRNEWKRSGSTFSPYSKYSQEFSCSSLATTDP